MKLEKVGLPLDHTRKPENVAVAWALAIGELIRRSMGTWRGGAGTFLRAS